MLINLTFSTHPFIQGSNPEFLEIELRALQSETELSSDEAWEHEKGTFHSPLCRGFSPGRLYRTSRRGEPIEVPPHRIEGARVFYRFHAGSEEAVFLADTWVEDHGPATYLVEVSYHDDLGQPCLRDLAVTYIHNERIDRPEAELRQELILEGSLGHIDPHISVDLSPFKKGSLRAGSGVVCPDALGGSDGEVTREPSGLGAIRSVRSVRSRIAIRVGGVRKQDRVASLLHCFIVSSRGMCFMRRPRSAG